MVDSTENAPTATPAETASCWLTLTSVVARLICAGSTSAYASVLMAVNCSERKKPPTTSRIMISSNGVAMVNSAQAARKIELTTALMVMMILLVVGGFFRSLQFTAIN